MAEQAPACAGCRQLNQRISELDAQLADSQARGERALSAVTGPGGFLSRIFTLDDQLAESIKFCDLVGRTDDTDGRKADA